MNWLLIGIGLFSLVLAAGIALVSTAAEAEAYQRKAEPTAEEPHILPVTVIDLDGSVIAPPGVPIWEPTRRAFLIYENLFMKHPGLLINQEQYLYDVAGTPVTPYQAQRMSEYHAYAE